MRSMVDGKGLEPSTSAMRTPRSPSWANRPNQPFFNQKNCEKWIFKIFNFERIVRKNVRGTGNKNRGRDVRPYGYEPYALPDWATGPNQQFQKRNRKIKQYEIIDVAENRTLCAPSWATSPNSFCNGKCYYTIISSIVKTVFFRKMKIFCCQFAEDIVK